MLLTYVDESYTDDWFAMAALLVDGPEAVALTDGLDRVAVAAAKAYGLGTGVERVWGLVRPALHTGAPC